MPTRTRPIHRLTARTVETLDKPGRHSDGGNLYLSISPARAKSWVFLYRWHGKLTEIGLGSLREVSLAQARERAAKARQKLEAGENPKQSRRTAGEASFGACAEQLIASLRPSWRNDLHASQWQTTLLKDAARLAPIPVDKITTEDVLAVLTPLWQTKRTTAERLRGRIERVLDAAKARGLRPEDKANPARWRGHLDHILPRRGRHEGVRHHAALPYAEVPAFMAALRNEGGMAARALEFAIITAARSGEVIGARWSEIDLEEKTWTVPAERMKAGVLHRVPLSHAALAILRPLHEAGASEFVFPGLRGQLNRTVMRKLLERRMNARVATVHGFRSAFRDWAAETTRFPREVAELALAHTVGSAVERAYRRSDLFELRRQLMEGWGEFCTAERGKVLAFRGNSVSERLPSHPQ